jgi:integrase/recombinase XerD
MTALAPILEAFFTDRLMTQRGASPHTIASYRDTFTLLPGHLHQQTGKLPAQLHLADLDAPTIGTFLQHLETARGNSAATRNARLAAIRSLSRHASLRAPEHAALIGRVLAIQPKRTATTIVSYLTPSELDALLTAPDRATWHGRRDHALLVFAAQTGLRVSELTALATRDVHLGTGPHAYCHGKGRKDRATPLTPTPCTSSPPGSPGSTPAQPARYSPPGPEPRYPATPSSTWSPGTPPPRPRHAPPCKPRRSRRTPCGTPRR